MAVTVTVSPASTSDVVTVYLYIISAVAVVTAVLVNVGASPTNTLTPAFLPIVCTPVDKPKPLLGVIVRVDRILPSNAPSPTVAEISVTLSGIYMVVNELQS